MRILISGATGLVGKVLIKQALLDGHEIHFLTRSKAKIGFHKGVIGFYWNPNEHKIDVKFSEIVFVGISCLNQKEKKEQRSVDKTVEKSTKLDKFEKMGQKFECPDENDGTRKFYESILIEEPTSKFALKWCLENGVLDEANAKTVYNNLSCY